MIGHMVIDEVNHIQQLIDDLGPALEPWQTVNQFFNII
jgi:hypothetical protein